MFDYESPKEKEPVDYTGLKIGLVLLPVFFLITFLYNADAGLAACIVFGMIALAVKIRWHLRKHIWFWAIIAVILALHVPLVFMVQWPKNAPTIFYAMPIGIADFLIISGALKFAENLMSNGSPSNDENE
jgi:hypothetical protein